MKRSLVGLMQALVAHRIHLHILHHLRQLVLCLIDLGIYGFYVSLVHLMIRHSAGWAVYIHELLPAIDMNQVSAFHWDIALGREVEVLQANRAP